MRNGGIFTKKGKVIVASTASEATLAYFTLKVFPQHFLERWDFGDFCRCNDRKFYGQEKIQGILFSSLTAERNDNFPP